MLYKMGGLYIDIIFQLAKFLNPLLDLINNTKQREIFQNFIVGLILENKYFSAFKISKGTKNKNYWQFRYQLDQPINWRKILYKLAKTVIKEFPEQRLFLIADGSPLKQQNAQYRITKDSLVDISKRKLFHKMS